MEKSRIKAMKSLLVKGILSQMNSEMGYDCVIWNAENQERELCVINKDTEYVPSYWHAGISNGASFRFGDNLARVEFASEEAKRMFRNWHSDEEAHFITWAWHNYDFCV